MTRLNQHSLIGKVFAVMFGGMVADYIARGESVENIYILAVRAGHNANTFLDGDRS